MKYYLIPCILLVFLVFRPFFLSAQEIRQTSHPNITITTVEGESDKWIYHLPFKASYTVSREGYSIKLIQGTGSNVDITGLVPGVYYIKYKDETGNGIIDRFTISWDK